MEFTEYNPENEYYRRFWGKKKREVRERGRGRERGRKKGRVKMII